MSVSRARFREHRIRQHRLREHRLVEQQRQHGNLTSPVAAAGVVTSGSLQLR